MWATRVGTKPKSAQSKSFEGVAAAVAAAAGTAVAQRKSARTVAMKMLLIVI